MPIRNRKQPRDFIGDLQIANYTVLDKEFIQHSDAVLWISFVKNRMYYFLLAISFVGLLVY